MVGWIKLHRKLMDKSFYSKDSEKVHLWIHLLMKANHSGREEYLGGKPIKCEPGQFTTGRKQLSIETGIGESKIERMLNYFEKIEQQIEQQKTTVNRLISVCNWYSYQEGEQPFEQKSNNDRTTTEQRVNTLQEYKNNKNDKNIKTSAKLSNEDFYKQQIELSDNNPAYKKYVDVLFGNNDAGYILNGILGMEKQITFDQFQKLLAKSKEKNESLIKLTLAFENGKYFKNKKSIYLSLNDWLNKR